MRSNNILLSIVFIFALPSFSSARYGQQGKAKHRTMEEHQKSLPTSSEMNKIKAAAINEVQSSMAENPDVDEMMRRIDDLVEKRKREQFPKAFEDPRIYRSKFNQSVDIWENGTVVRYMARILAFLLFLTGVYAFRDHIFGIKIPQDGESRKNR